MKPHSRIDRHRVRELARAIVEIAAANGGTVETGHLLSRGFTRAEIEALGELAREEAAKTMCRDDGRRAA
ncbi:hypothetical protein [Oceanibacterium hippocampi]|uniref:Uncharacterized protein n=1 Tax=Oceanibacterium hippocampi TaxID=745714 RepID=A0A1Y5U5B6_9PROT|nr:hypothetical protein [Oceanibacterium hippocampi]SLN77526.1 hypothetical protein OCH7691_04443 [Oceanibacterium hippocampi]